MGNLSPAGARLNAAASRAVLHTAAVVAMVHRDIFAVEHAKAHEHDKERASETKRSRRNEGSNEKKTIQTLSMIAIIYAV